VYQLERGTLSLAQIPYVIATQTLLKVCDRANSVWQEQATSSGSHVDWIVIVNLGAFVNNVFDLVCVRRCQAR
jgi:hypothetical protein